MPVLSQRAATQRNQATQLPSASGLPSLPEGAAPEEEAFEPGSQPGSPAVGRTPSRLGALTAAPPPPPLSPVLSPRGSLRRGSLDAGGLAAGPRPASRLGSALLAPSAHALQLPPAPQQAM
jgi:hypothetical protein